MGTTQILLPLLRTSVRAGVRPGRPLPGAALLRCLTPSWVLLRPRPNARRLVWSEEAVTVHRALVARDRPRQSHLDGRACSLVLHANAQLVSGRYEDALAVADESRAVPGVQASATRTACALYIRASALAGAGRLDEALVQAGECVAARADEAVTALRRIHAPTRRTRLSEVHAACVTAFAGARAQAPEEIGQAWRRATDDPFPSFVYRAP
ncbi:hypothetical protein [Streptomyces sp. BE133]|uniref:hypothetical protein n=1 Tax=Streptomyces sp. BE133 TaxID=3002523 RepID=UPI002E79182C|nr:hypothetical protein [Streptomyces sp. BE133]MEE1813411.1 hypothetical protein [Streptomyces sp. BE133]